VIGALLVVSLVVPALAQAHPAARRDPASQTVTVDLPTSLRYGYPDLGIAGRVTISSGLPISSTDASGACTLTPDGKKLRFMGPGTCSVTVHQNGNASFAPASGSGEIEITKARVDVKRFKVSSKKVTSGTQVNLDIRLRRPPQKATGDVAGWVIITRNDVEVLQIPVSGPGRLFRVQSPYTVTGTPGTSVVLGAAYSGNETYIGKKTKSVSVKIVNG
jgi:hypothetical protein